MLRPAKRAVLVLLLILAPVAVAACGGDDEEASAPVPADEPVETSLSRSELISAGDGICAEVNSAIGTIQAAEASDETVKENQIADLYAGIAQRLEDLGTPTDGDAPTEVIDAASALGDPDEADPEAALAAFQSAAADYGFTDCAEDPSAPVTTDGQGDAGSDSGTDGGTADQAPAPAPTPAPTPAPAPAPAPTEPPTGGGVAPTEPDSGGGSGGSSGGISPG